MDVEGLHKFFRYVEKSPCDCFMWNGTKTKFGYGIFRWRGKNHASHRWLYQQVVKRLSKKQVLDHLCRNRLCINPQHLEPVSNRENILRGFGACAVHARKTHCKYGHEFTKENTLTYGHGNGRICKTCERRRSKKSYAIRRKRTPPMI